METIRRHALPVAALFALCALAAGLKLTYLGVTPNSDYASYVATAQVFAGSPIAPRYPERILKPLAPLVVTVLAPIAGYPIAFLFELIFFYFAFALALYALGYIFFERRSLAFMLGCLGALSYPMLHYGIDLYTETGAQFFYVLSLALTLLYVKRPSRSLLALDALSIGIGFLWKEYSVVAGVALGLVLLFEQVELKAKAKNIAFLAALALLPSVIVQTWVYSAFHYSYLDWYRIGGAPGFKSEFTLRNLAKSTAALLGLAWLLVPLGIARWRKLSAWQQRFLACALPPPFIVLVWGYVSSRLFFVLATPFLLLAIFGLASWPRPLRWLAFAACVAVNIAWLYFHLAPTTY